MKITNPLVVLGVLGILVAGAALWRGHQVRERDAAIATAELAARQQLAAKAAAAAKEKAEEGRLRDFDRRWLDLSRLAASTARIALPPIVQEMQTQRRELEAMKIGGCRADAHAALVMAVGAEVDMYLAFMTQRGMDELTLRQAAKKSRAEYADEMDACS